MKSILKDDCKKCSSTESIRYAIFLWITALLIAHKGAVYPLENRIQNEP